MLVRIPVRMLFREYILNFFYDGSLWTSTVRADPGEDGVISDSSAPSASAIEDDPVLAVMRKDIQDPKLYKIYENLPKLR